MRDAIIKHSEGMISVAVSANSREQVDLVRGSGMFKRLEGKLGTARAEAFLAGDEAPMAHISLASPRPSEG